MFGGEASIGNRHSANGDGGHKYRGTVFGNEARMEVRHTAIGNGIHRLLNESQALPKLYNCLPALSYSSISLSHNLGFIYLE